MGERTWDALRCLDYVVTLPEVDPTRLAVAGLSLGGETTMYVAALDERLKLACSSGWLTTIANMKNGHCVCYNFPGLEENFEFSDIFACVAPRPLVCELGEQEKAPGGFPVPIGRQAFEQMRAAYRVFNAESNLTLTVHPGPHVFNGQDFWPLLRRTLGAPVSALCIPPPNEAFPEMRKAWDTEARLPASLTNDAQRHLLYRQAEKNGRLANEAFFRCRRYIDGWLAHCDSTSGLFPRNLRDSTGANALPALAVDDPQHQYLAAFTSAGRLLVIELKELPVLPKGKGNKIIQIPRKKLVSREEFLKHLVVFDPQGCLVVHSGKRSFKLTPEIVRSYMGERGRRGKKLPRGFRTVDRVEREAADTGAKPAQTPEQVTFDNF